MRKFCFVALAVLAFGNAARAAIVLHVPDIVLTQSASVQTGSFDVYLEEETGSDQADVQGYDIGVRQSPGGTITFTGFSASGAAHPSLFNGQVPDDTTANVPGYVAGTDIHLSDSFPQAGAPQNAPVSNNTRDGLFSVSYSIPANAVGTFALNVDTNPTRFAIFDAAANDVVVVIDNGSITINPVPEPAALGLILLGLPLLGRRRK